MSRNVYEGFSEVYEVVKTVQVVGENNKTYKIEILEDFLAVGSDFEETRFSQRVYVEAEIDANVVTKPQDGPHSAILSSSVWVHVLHVHMVRRGSIEQALEDALFHLRELSDADD